MAKWVYVSVVVALAARHLAPWNVGIPARAEDVVERKNGSPGRRLVRALPDEQVRAHVASDLGFPLVLEPLKNNSASFAKEWVVRNKAWLDDALYHHGAILFRGFDLASANDFEQVAQECIAPEVLFNGVYLGTSPRESSIDKTKAVYTASEIPSWQTVSPHLEMSFRRKGMPQKILFFAAQPNKGPGGETPLVDFQAVWEEMDPELKARFETKGLKYVRHYFSDQAGGRNSAVFPLIHHAAFQKSWEAMFKTTDKSKAEEQALEQGFQVEWLYGSANMMRLTHTMNVTRNHPVSNQAVWNNHLTVIHSSGYTDEFAMNFHRKDASVVWKVQMGLTYAFMRVASLVTEFCLGHEGLGMQTTYADGTPIPIEDVRAVRQLVWRNMFTAPWHKGSFAFLDNNRIAHGRNPFYGPRKILVTWTQPEGEA